MQWKRRVFHQASPSKQHLNWKTFSELRGENVVQTVHRLPSFLACACTHTHTHRTGCQHTTPACSLALGADAPDAPTRAVPEGSEEAPPRFPGFRNSLIHFLHGRTCLLGWVGLLFPPSLFPVRQPASQAPRRW